MTTLATRLRTTREQANLTQAELGKLVGVSQNAIQKIESGKTLEPRNLLQLAMALKVDPLWLQTGKSNATNEQQKTGSSISEFGSFDTWDRNTPLSEDDVEIPLLKDIRLAAGNGFADDIMDYNNFKLRFSQATLKRYGIQPENAICVIADGNSMEPVIPDQATVGIDTGNKTIRDGKIYAINHGGLLRIKILYNLPNYQVRIHSYNEEEHRDEISDLQDITVIGKVFWYSVLL